MVSHLNLEMNGYNQLIADAGRPDDVNLVATPVYHMGAVFMAVTYMLLGCTQVILPQFTAAGWLETLERTRATVSLLIPTMINAILNAPELGRHDTSTLRLIFYGGGPMPPAVLERAMRTFRCAFTQGYGLTETLEATFLVAADHVIDGTPDQRRRLASAGREAVGAEVSIVDDAGRDLPPGEVGEILVHSRSVIRGYWRQPEAGAEVIRNGWFHTGDLGYLDDGRYLFVVDRKKDMVVTGGVNVYTKEVEAVLYEHPAVREAAVFGVPDDNWGERVTAAIALKPDATATAEELIAHCRAQLASFKLPKRVVFLDALPKNPSGKILKRELRQVDGVR
jgi:long-chain acyl-CoA synthetase